MDPLLLIAGSVLFIQASYVAAKKISQKLKAENIPPFSPVIAQICKSIESDEAGWSVQNNSTGQPIYVNWDMGVQFCLVHPQNLLAPYTYRLEGAELKAVESAVEQWHLSKIIAARAKIADKALDSFKEEPVLFSKPPAKLSAKTVQPKRKISIKNRQDSVFSER